MKIYNKALKEKIDEWKTLPFSDEEHIKSFDEKSASFSDHIAPEALRYDTIKGEVWLKEDMQLIFSRPILWATMHGELIKLMGYDGAKAVLYKAGFEYGFADAKNYLDYMSKALDAPTPYFNDILYASMGWGIWETKKFDPAKGELQLWGYNRADVNKFKSMYGESEHSVCFILEGFIAGICCVMYNRKIKVIETRCVAQGDPVCEFIAFPEEEFGMMNVTKKLQSTIENLKRIDGVLASAIVSRDGKILASAFQAAVEEEKVATITATIASLAKQAAQELERGEFNNVFIDSEQGYISLAKIGTEAVLVMLTSKKVLIGSVLVKLRNTVEEILSKKLLNI